MIKKRIIPNKLANVMIKLFDDQLTRHYPQYATLKAGQKKLERALTAAKATQSAIMPKEQPNFEGFEIHARFKPYYQVGGDYYDFMDLDKERLGIAIGDVSGKGLEAALTSHSMHAALDVTSRTNTSSNISDIVYSLNNFMYEHTERDRFATLIYGELSKDQFKYCNAGHHYPLLYMNGLITLVENGNLVLGIKPNYQYKTFSIDLNKGDFLLLYSDGVIEALDSNGLREVYGTLQKFSDQPSKIISSEIHNVLEKYKRMDDQTTIVIKKL